jgi:hypothetical protein
VAGAGRQGQAAAAPPCLSIPAELFDTRNFCTLVYRKLLPPGLLPAPEVNKPGRAAQHQRPLICICRHLLAPTRHAVSVERTQATARAHQGVLTLRAGVGGSQEAQPGRLCPPEHHPAQPVVCGGMPHCRPLRPLQRGLQLKLLVPAGGKGRSCADSFYSHWHICIACHPAIHVCVGRSTGSRTGAAVAPLPVHADYAAPHLIGSSSEAPPDPARVCPLRPSRSRK